jgi:hypothetical protein
LQLKPFLTTTRALVLCLGAALPQQDDGQSPLERAREAQRQKQLEEAPPLLGTDGKPILPGQLPPGTSAAASALWTAVLERSGAGQPIRSFELSFYLRQRDPNHPQVNDLDLRFSYLVPGYVRAVLESGRTLLRGPRGDYLIDQQETISLVGREGIEDREQLDQMASLARNFVALSDPRSLRLVELAVEPAPPSGLPSRYAQETKGLSWLRVVSPDFFLGSAQARPAGTPPPLYSAALGIEPETREIRFAVLHEQKLKLEGEQQVTALVPETAMLVRLAEYTDRNGFHVPHSVRVFGLDATMVPARFRSSPTSELTLRKRRGSLRAGLRPTDFQPSL